ncbi:hypothetical protein ACVPOR_13145 [Staphylococcus aureus]
MKYLSDNDMRFKYEYYNREKRYVQQT